MKNKLDFKIQFSKLWCHSFPNCFAGVYVYLEKVYGDLPQKCPGRDTVCFGCAGCDNPEPQSIYFCLFDTLCGRSALHLRFDGALTEMAALIGDGDGAGGWSGKCGTDYTVDFLFGFAGYEYRKMTDGAMFKSEITASIDSGRPVIAELAAEGSFLVITGYDEDTPISSFYSTDQGKNVYEKLTKTPSYDEIKTLYVVGDKVTPRYTLKDGLERVKRVMENNFEEKIWDGGIEEVKELLLPDKKSEKISPDEMKERIKRLTNTIVNQFNSHTFGMAFCNSQYSEMLDPALSDLWKKLHKCFRRLYKYDHPAGQFNKLNFSNLGSFRSGMGQMFVQAIEDIKNIHKEKLDIINQAIEILEKKGK